MPTITGSNDDPEFRTERARLAAHASHSTDTLIQRIADRAPELTEDQRAKLANLLRINSNGGSR